MRLIYILIVTLFLSVSSNAQEDSTDEVETYDYDTTLKGGYSISFRVDDSLQYLYLKKGNKTITELSSASRGMLSKNLGYVGADFTNYFVLVHSFGSGNPHYIELIMKSTGKNVLKDDAAWIGVDTVKQVLLFSKVDVPNEKDNMTLLDIKTMRQRDYPFPKEIFGEAEALNRIELLNVTDKTFTIKYSFKDWSITKKKVYTR
jgi:hypothetical protein